CASRESTCGGASKQFEDLSPARLRPEVEQLSAIVAAPSFKFVVQLRQEHVGAIDAAVRASTVIVRKVKKMILAGYG
ncbi:MAG TPA: hypothetical protein VFO89_12965, partial [Thermoanaerobaculia bacterium]|nr:hypothetical protein [Thermoanaerobaculia bacterium]